MPHYWDVSQFLRTGRKTRMTFLGEPKPQYHDGRIVGYTGRDPSNGACEVIDTDSTTVFKAIYRGKLPSPLFKTGQRFRYKGSRETVYVAAVRLTHSRGWEYLLRTSGEGRSGQKWRSEHRLNTPSAITKLPTE